MYPITVDIFKIEEKKLHQQAAQYHLMKSLKRPGPRISKVYEAVGRVLIQTGQRLLKRSQAAAC
jgi:hypothetical protein